ncbi:hypothetical protein GDO81_007474 [Engystomops pustulosus]|uniref:Secreted protein n=1 Tax=Engystomops pustulosus TaxID=76066 RepID=A0AAV7C7N8_ENGPU|nr:hypothetical protein GDO81_007474 [Engystomops pustulosus]
MSRLRYLFYAVTHLVVPVPTSHGCNQAEILELNHLKMHSLFPAVHILQVSPYWCLLPVTSVAQVFTEWGVLTVTVRSYGTNIPGYGHISV